MQILNNRKWIKKQVFIDISQKMLRREFQESLSQRHGNDS